MGTFKAEGYYSETEIGTSEFKYSTIVALAETEQYFVFIFGQNHAQVYDKRIIAGGTMEDFRDFITTATGKNIEIV